MSVPSKITPRIGSRLPRNKRPPAMMERAAEPSYKCRKFHKQQSATSAVQAMTKDGVQTGSQAMTKDGVQTLRSQRIARNARDAMSSFAPNAAKNGAKNVAHIDQRTSILYVI